MPFGIVANERRPGFRVESIVLRWLENHNLDSGSVKRISSTIATWFTVEVVQWVPRAMTISNDSDEETRLTGNQAADKCIPAFGDLWTNVLNKAIPWEPNWSVLGSAPDVVRWGQKFSKPSYSEFLWWIISCHRRHNSVTFPATIHPVGDIGPALLAQEIIKHQRILSIGTLF